MTDITQGLPQDVQEAIGTAPAGPQPTGFTGPQGSAFDSGTGRIPVPQVPMRPAEQPEEEDAPEVDGVTKMANLFFEHMLRKDSPTPPPGSFASKLAGAVGGASGALTNVFGDAAAGSRAKGGWLSGAEAAMESRSARLEREKQADFDRQERLKNDQINLAKANMDAVTHARMLQNMDKPIRDAAAKSLSSFFGVLEENGFKVEDRLSYDQMMDKMKDPQFAATHTGGITGYEPQLDATGQVVKDSKGLPIEVPYYGIANISPGDASKKITVTDNLAKKWSNAGLPDVSAGTPIPASLAVMLNQKAEKYQTVTSILDAKKVQPLSDEVKSQMVNALNDPTVAHAVSMNPGSPLGGLYDASDTIGSQLKAAQQELSDLQRGIMGGKPLPKGYTVDPAQIKQAQQRVADLQTIQKNLDTTIGMGFTPTERSAYQKQVEADRKQTEIEKQNAARDTETHRHNIAEEDIKRLEASGGAPEVMADIAGKLADATMVPSQLSKRSKQYNQTWNAADTASWNKYGKPYDGAQAESEFTYSKQKTTQDTLKLIDGVVDKGGSLEIAQNAAKGLPGMDQQTLNKVFNLAKGEFGNQAITDFHTAMLGLADEYSKIMGGGVSSDTGRQQALDLLKDAYSKGQMAGAVAIVKKDIAARQRAIIGKNRFLQKQYYGSNGMTATMIAPDGKTVQEVPVSQTGYYTSKGARLATKQDNLPTADH